ncbi:MAG TPA: hypothetical protein PKC18_09600 [Lacipirellulaceae bacterium]|nr:hypothetical protein [Lacipirellulaceae bacterium]
MLAADHLLGSLESVVALADAMPAIDGPFLLRTVLRVLHLLCAIILGGGVFYMRTMLAHAGADACFAGRQKTWARWVAFASAVLLVSGMFSYVFYIRDAKQPGASALPMVYHVFFLMKFLLGFFVMFVAALIAGKSPAAERARQNITSWLNRAWTSVMAIVIIATFMRMMHA